MAINLPEFSEDMDIIQKLGDTPGTDNNLDWKQMQAKFDEGGNLLKTYLNTIIPLLNAAFSNEGSVITGGTLIGDLDINGNRLFGIGAPTADSDAANKGYVDAAEANAKNASLPKAGGTMAGIIDMAWNRITNVSTPVADADAATKDYVDGKRAAYTAVLTKQWVGSGPYTQTVAVSGILASDMPHVTPVYKSDSTDTDAIVNRRIEQWAKVSYAEAVTGGIKFTCMEDPAFDYLLKIQIEVMR